MVKPFSYEEASQQERHFLITAACQGYVSIPVDLPVHCGLLYRDLLPPHLHWPAAMRHMAAWFGGTNLLNAVVLYGLWRCNSRLMARVALGVRVDA